MMPMATLEGAPPAKPVLILAPIRGVTDWVFRNAFDEFFGGFHKAMAPFISTIRARRYKPSQLRDVMPENNHGAPLIPQIMGNDAKDFVALARTLADLGYTQVNWNIGCPFRRVAAKFRGCGLLPHPDRIDAFLDRTLADLPVSLSIKTRLGRFDADEIAALIPVFNRYPLAELILHPRTGQQMYTGEPNLEAYGVCLDASVHPVVYNGDICDAGRFGDLEQGFPETAAWMIGRGALADPWLPGRIGGGSKSRPGDMGALRRFHDRLVAEYARILSGPKHPVDRMKGLWRYLSRSFHQGRRILKEIQKTQTLDRYRKTVDRFFDQCPRWIA